MQLKKLILTCCFSILLANLSYSQIWPFSPMLRFGNTVYIDTDTESLVEANQENILFETGLENRYFDVLFSTDSLEIEMDNKPVYFSQKPRKEPKNRRTILFYSRRKLENKEQKITYLKIKKIESNRIIAEASLKNKNTSPAKEKKLIKIDISNLDGVFIGPQRGLRTTMTFLGVAGGVGAFFLL